MSELCLTIVKNNHTGESDTKIFVWDYITITMLTVKEFDHHVESIVCNKINTNKFIFFSLYYCAIWEYAPLRKKLSQTFLYVNDFREVSDAVFIQIGMFEGIAISYRSQRVEFYNNNHEPHKAFNLNDIYPNLVRNQQLSLQQATDPVVDQTPLVSLENAGSSGDKTATNYC